MSPKRVTQQDIAVKAGVHRATVSLAFKNHPSLPLSTRERILKIADEMGYRPDPVLSALTAYRNSNQSRSFQGTLAWLVIYDQNAKNDWRNSSVFVQYYEGAKERADKHGYQLEIFELEPLKIGYKRMVSILKARNVNGILLCLQPNPYMTLEFDWESFSFVTFGYSLLRPKLHTATATQYRSMVQTMNKMHERGYRRIGFAFNPTHDERADHNFLAGYLISQQLIGEAPVIFEHRYWEIEKFKTDLRKKTQNGGRLDALVTGAPKMARHLSESGIEIPEEIALACPCIGNKDTEISGICEDSHQIGKTAVDQLTNMILRGERGIPEKALRIHVEGMWHEGKTLPDRNLCK